MKLDALERLRPVHEGLGGPPWPTWCWARRVLTGLAFLYVRHNVEEREHERFEEITVSTERAVDRRMQTYIDAMLDGRGLFAASESVTREEWEDYVAGSDLERRYPGIQAIAYAERVPLEGREAHERRVRAQGFQPMPCGPPESATSTSRSST